MSGWASIERVALAGTVALTRGQVRVLAQQAQQAQQVMQVRECGAMPNACGHAVPWPDHWRSR